MPDIDTDSLSDSSIDDAAPHIGRGLCVTGEITGSRDLYIEGEVSGSIFLPDNHVVVGGTADVQANISARIVEVAGNVIGDLNAADRIVIRSSSSVEGDIMAPQIQLEEGCQFKGSVQMREPDMSQQPPVRARAARDPDAVRFKAANG